MKDSTSAESRTTCEARTRTARPGVLRPQRSCGVRKLDLYHQVQLRQHLPAAQDAHHGGAQQRVRVGALVHRGVVHLVEAHSLVLVVLAALQQVMHGHGAAVVVNVVSSQRWPLAKSWILWMKQAGFGVAGASGLLTCYVGAPRRAAVSPSEISGVPRQADVLEPR